VNPLWLSQVRGILRLELRKNLFSMRAMPLYLLASTPLLAAALFIMVSSFSGIPEDVRGPVGASTFFAYFFQFVLNFPVYFGCAWIFMNLFRGEVLDRSLHYYFLAPVRRDVLVAGKYVSALVSTAIVFIGTTATCFLSLYSFLGGWGNGGLAIGGQGVTQLVTYLFVVGLACLGYGAVFLAVGLFLRNPVVPALILFLWEGANPLLPGLQEGQHHVLPAVALPGSTGGGPAGVDRGAGLRMDRGAGPGGVHRADPGAVGYAHPTDGGRLRLRLSARRSPCVSRLSRPSPPVSRRCRCQTTS